MMKSGALALALAVAGTTAGMGQASQTAIDAERALRVAIEAEVISGDIETAVAEYRRLAASDDRGVAARALLRLARRQAIRGDADALATYDRVIRDFDDQPDAAAEAVARRADLHAEQAGAQHRLVWDDAVDLWGGVSADGRWLSFVDWETGDLGLRDLTTGENRRLTDYGGYANGEVEANVVSPDGRRIAFTYDRWDERAAAEAFFELRVIGADGSGPRTLLQSLDYAYLEPQAWSPDGSRLALQMRYREAAAGPSRTLLRGGDVVTIGTDGQNMRVVASHADLVPWRIRYSPDGTWISYELRDTTDRPGGSQVRGVAVVRADASQPPVMLVAAARNMGWSPDGRHLLFTRERVGMNELHAAPFASGRLTGSPVTLKVSGDIGDPMGMTPDGRLFYGTTRRNADAVLANFDVATGAARDFSVLRPVMGQLSVRGIGLPHFSADGRQLAMVTGPSTIVLRDVASGEEQVVLPALPDIRAIRWAPDGRSLFVSGRDNQPGIFRVDLDTQSTTLEFRTQTPVFAVSPDGGTIYYRQQGDPAISARNRRSGATRKVADWSGTLFDIVPSVDGATLAISGPARLLFVDLETGTARVRWEDPGPGGARLREGAWTPDGRMFVAHFFDPEENVRELWTLPVQGGEPRRFPLDGQFMGVSLSPDGKRLAIMRADSTYQLWVLENFLPAGAR